MCDGVAGFALATVVNRAHVIHVVSSRNYNEFTGISVVGRIGFHLAVVNAKRSSRSMSTPLLYTLRSRLYSNEQLTNVTPFLSHQYDHLPSHNFVLTSNRFAYAQV
jgi:hypothetical protein